jgi:hypothetical protein
VPSSQTDAQSSERFDQHADVVMGALDDDIASLVDEKDVFLRHMYTTLA